MGSGSESEEHARPDRRSRRWASSATLVCLVPPRCLPAHQRDNGGPSRRFDDRGDIWALRLFAQNVRFRCSQSPPQITLALPSSPIFLHILQKFQQGLSGRAHSIGRLRLRLREARGVKTIKIEIERIHGGLGLFSALARGDRITQLVDDRLSPQSRVDAKT